MLSLAVLSHIVSATAPQNDAGFPGDASDAKSAPTLLPGPGEYAGELRSHDADWYATLHAGGPLCVSALIAGDTDSSATLELATAAGPRSIRSEIPASDAVRLTLAGSSVPRVLYGFETDPNPTGREAARPREYTFDITATRPMGAGDAGTDRDAGNLLSGALPAQGACTEGDLRPLHGLGDALDIFTFHATEGTQVVYSLGATSPVRLRMVAPDGASLGEVGTDAVGSFVAPSTGTYSMQAAALGDASSIEYVIGLVGPDPPGHPCRPYCMTG